MLVGVPPFSVAAGAQAEMGGTVMALYKVRMTEGITFKIEDERGIEQLAGDLARTGHLITNRPQISSRRVIARTPLVLMLGNVISIEPSSLDE